MSNRLADETSPYLLQHEDNPVDWYPWGEEALERAREEDRPILLSIGYSACHWCHVMERESFEDPGVAEVMNRHFVNVKVDREERPDLDSVYMTAVQSMTGSGGWPLTVFLTPEGVPFYGGTYFPPEPRQGMPSFRQVLDATASAYRDRPDEVREAAEKLVGALRRATTAGGEDRNDEEAELDRIGAEILTEAVRSASSRFDESNGGFGRAPKFPQAPLLDFLLRRHAEDPRALDMVTKSLRAMARGGIRDHLGGGFHRYTVDGRWLVPHFEKMLYDNALLARVYLHHHQITRSERSRAVAEETLDYLVEDMRSEEGGFYAARDADSEGEEGRYYVWTADEVDAVLADAPGADRVAELFRKAYAVTPEGNWEGRSILHLPRGLNEVAEEAGLSREELAERLTRAREKLLERRREREPPLRDEKVLTGWNGLVLRALAEAGAALGRPDYTEAARKGADFILDRMRKNGRLFHTWKDGRARVPGFLEDYAALGNALLTLHEVTLEPRWLYEAAWCTRKVVELFWDGESELFFDTPEDGEELVVRPRDAMDNPSPSGTSLAAELLLRMGIVLDDPELRRVTRIVLSRDLGTVRRHATAFGTLLGCLDFHLSDPVEVAVVGHRDTDATDEILRIVHERYLPNRVVVGTEPDVDRAEPEAPPKPGAAEDEGGPAGTPHFEWDLPDEIPLLRGRDMRDGTTTVYVCRNYACREPMTDPEDIDRLLAESRG
ncbi:MAG: thioredoxin domain-containing protein [Gemmatimonadota bacterium]